MHNGSERLRHSKAVACMSLKQRGNLVCRGVKMCLQLVLNFFESVLDLCNLKRVLANIALYFRRGAIVQFLFLQPKDYLLPL